MPTTRRSRALSAAPPVVWKTVGDPHHLPRWWPMVARVEQVDDDAFTELMKTAKGRGVRADFTIVERRAPEVFRYDQQVEGSPFERILRENETTVELVPSGDGTLVSLTRRTKLKGFSSFGGFMWRRAAAKQLDEALDALERLYG